MLITRRTMILPVSLAALGVLAASMLVFRQRDTYRCTQCHSMKDVNQWRLGDWQDGSVPMSSSSAVVRSSQIARNFFRPGHRHTWAYFQGSPYIFFGTKWRGCALGSSRPNMFCEWYEADEHFRRVVASKVQEGLLTEEQVRELCSLPPWDMNLEVAMASDSRVMLAESLIEESLEPDR